MVKSKEHWVIGLGCLYSNSTLETLILMSIFGIAKNLNVTLDIPTPFMGPNAHCDLVFFSIPTPCA